jgi:hypothetical protein
MLHLMATVLTRHMVHRCYALQRKGRYQEVELHEAIPSSLPGPSANCQRTQIREQVDEALARLSPEQRVVVPLKEVGGPAISRNCGDSRYFYRHNDVQTLLCQEKATVYVKASLQANFTMRASRHLFERPSAVNRESGNLLNRSP